MSRRPYHTWKRNERPVRDTMPDWLDINVGASSYKSNNLLRFAHLPPPPFVIPRNLWPRYTRKTNYCFLCRIAIYLFLRTGFLPSNTQSQEHDFKLRCQKPLKDPVHHHKTFTYLLSRSLDPFYVTWRRKNVVFSLLKRMGKFWISLNEMCFHYRILQEFSWVYTYRYLQRCTNHRLTPTLHFI